MAAAPPSAEPRRFGRYVTGGLFLLPAAFVLTVWIIYPAVYTIVRSFFGQQGYLGTWVGFANYKRIFTTHELLIAIRNNAIWVAVVPAFVTASRSAPSRARITPPLRSQTMRGRSSANSSEG